MTRATHTICFGLAFALLGCGPELVVTPDGWPVPLPLCPPELSENAPRQELSQERIAVSGTRVFVLYKYAYPSDCGEVAPLPADQRPELTDEGPLDRYWVTWTDDHGQSFRAPQLISVTTTTGRGTSPVLKSGAEGVAWAMVSLTSEPLAGRWRVVRIEPDQDQWLEVIDIDEPPPANPGFSSLLLLDLVPHEDQVDVVAWWRNTGSPQPVFRASRETGWEFDVLAEAEHPALPFVEVDTRSSPLEPFNGAFQWVDGGLGVATVQGDRLQFEDLDSGSEQSTALPPETTPVLQEDRTFELAGGTGEVYGFVQQQQSWPYSRHLVKMPVPGSTLQTRPLTLHEGLGDLDQGVESLSLGTRGEVDPWVIQHYPTGFEVSLWTDGELREDGRRFEPAIGVGGSYGPVASALDSEGWVYFLDRNQDVLDGVQLEVLAE